MTVRASSGESESVTSSMRLCISPRVWRTSVSAVAVGTISSDRRSVGWGRRVRCPLASSRSIRAVVDGVEMFSKRERSFGLTFLPALWPRITKRIASRSVSFIFMSLRVRLRIAVSAVR